jgi:hypothetical protein
LISHLLKDLTSLQNYASSSSSSAPCLNPHSLALVLFNLAKHLDPKILNPCLCEFTLSWSVSWGVSCTGPHVLVQCVVPLAHSYRAHPPLSPVPFPTTDSGSRANPTERLRLTSRFSLDIPPETQSELRMTSSKTRSVKITPSRIKIFPSLNVLILEKAQVELIRQFDISKTAVLYLESSKIENSVIQSMPVNMPGVSSSLKTFDMTIDKLSPNRK